MDHHTAHPILHRHLQITSRHPWRIVAGVALILGALVAATLIPGHSAPRGRSAAPIPDDSAVMTAGRR